MNKFTYVGFMNLNSCYFRLFSYHLVMSLNYWFEIEAFKITIVFEMIILIVSIIYMVIKSDLKAFY